MNTHILSDIYSPAVAYIELPVVDKNGTQPLTLSQLQSNFPATCNMKQFQMFFFSLFQYEHMSCMLCDCR